MSEEKNTNFRQIAPTAAYRNINVVKEWVLRHTRLTLRKCEVMMFNKVLAFKLRERSNEGGAIIGVKK